MRLSSIVLLVAAGSVLTASACGSSDAPANDTSSSTGPSGQRDGAVVFDGASSTFDAASMDATTETSGPIAEAGAEAAADAAADAAVDVGADASADAATDAALEPATPVRFVAIGDQGKGCATATDGQCKVAAAMEAKCALSGCDFGVLLGDNIYPAGATAPTDPVFQSVFEEPYANLNFPFYVALGNHDCGGDGAGTDFDVCEHEIAYTQISQKWKLPSRHYKQKFGGRTLELFVADTNSSMLAVASSVLVSDAPRFEAQDNAQRTDFASWLAGSTAAWKIAMGHHPMLSNGKHGNAGNYDCQKILGSCVSLPKPFNGAGVESFLNDAVCGKVDLYLSGHDHNRQWPLDTCKGTELIVSGGGASPEDFEGNNPVHVQKSTIGFVYIVVEEKKLTAEFIDETGNIEFSRSLTKP